jgi:hypothetical protein
MKAKYKLSLILWLAIITDSVAFTFQSGDKNDIKKGRWYVCSDVKFSEDYKCDQSFTKYQFNEDGTFLEIQPQGNHSGIYKLKGDKLSLKRNTIRTESTREKYGYNKYKIIWIDKDKFYSVSKNKHEGVIYTYFERVN